RRPEHRGDRGRAEHLSEDRGPRLGIRQGLSQTGNSTMAVTPEQLHQIEELYHAVRELPGGERMAMLDAAPPEISAEVESLLEGSTNSLPHLTISIPAGLKVEPGAMVRVYRLEQHLGEGGAGVVFKALDTKVNRPVAVKFLSEGIA